MGGIAQPMGWQDLVRMVAKANPGAPPAVIAAAVTKAMPLMNSESQQQWRLMQAFLAQQRIDQGQQRLEQGETSLQQKSMKFDEQKRQFDTRETRLQEGLESLKDDRARRAQQAADNARQKALQFSQTMDVKTRAQAFKEWESEHRAYDRIQRAKINAAANLSGADKKDMLKALDAEYGRVLQEIEQFKGQTEKGEQPNIPTRTPKDQVQDRFPKAEGVQPSGSKPIPQDKLEQIKQRLQASPEQKPEIMRRLQADGWSTEGL